MIIKRAFVIYSIMIYRSLNYAMITFLSIAMAMCYLLKTRHSFDGYPAVSEILISFIAIQMIGYQIFLVYRWIKSNTFDITWRIFLYPFSYLVVLADKDPEVSYWYEQNKLTKLSYKNKYLGNAWPDNKSYVYLLPNKSKVIQFKLRFG